VKNLEAERPFGDTSGLAQSREAVCIHTGKILAGLHTSSRLSLLNDLANYFHHTVCGFSVVFPIQE